MAYITASEYIEFTGRDSSEATTIRLNVASKLLDSRIGNYGTYSDGWKINTNDSTWYVNNFDALTTEQKVAIKMWVAEMVKNLYLNGDSAASNNNLKLGRFSVSKYASSSKSSSLLPEQMGYIDNLLVSSGLINRRIGNL